MDPTRPRWVCTLCGDVEYCDSDKYKQFEFPPIAADRAIRVRHVRLCCEGLFEYRAGLGPASNVRGAS